jgi:hypothetical protein
MEQCFRTYLRHIFDKFHAGNFLVLKTIVFRTSVIGFCRAQNEYFE